MGFDRYRIFPEKTNSDADMDIIGDDMKAKRIQTTHQMRCLD